MKTPSNQSTSIISATQYRNNRAEKKEAYELRTAICEEANLPVKFRAPLPPIFKPEELTLWQCQQYGKLRQKHICSGYDEEVNTIRKLGTRLKKVIPKSEKYYETYKEIRALVIHLYHTLFVLSIRNYLDDVYKTKYYAIVKVGDRRLTYGPYASQKQLNNIADGTTKPSLCKLIQLNGKTAKEMKWDQ